jgi:hypothetical protein
MAQQNRDSKDGTARHDERDLPGQALVDALKASPHREVNIDPTNRMRLPVRHVSVTH